MRIYVVTDQAGWCWASTVEEIARRLPQHEFVVTSKPRVDEAAAADLIWIRGYPYLFRNAAQAGVPVVWTFCTGGARAQDLIDRCRPYFGLGTVVCQNTATRELLVEAGAGKVVVIPNGVDADRFHPAERPPESFVVGMAANVNGERWINKGAAAVVEACRTKGVALRMATKPRPGAPSPAPEFDVGRIDHAAMPEFLRGLSVFAQPSNAEGCSNSIMEAMACGLPCIICIESGYHGSRCADGSIAPSGDVLFVRHNDPGDIKEALSWLKKYPEQAAQIGRNARRFAERHSWAQIAKTYEATFLDAVSKTADFHLVTVATRGYEDALRRLLPSWVANSGASSITVFSHEEIQGLPDGVKNVVGLSDPQNWVQGCMFKAAALAEFIEKRDNGERIVFVDGDCAILGDLRPLVAGREDLALTRFAVDPARYPRCAGTCSSGVVGIRVNPRTRAFVNLWDAAQACYAAYGHGIKPGKVACDQYALTDLARGRACGVTVRAMDERVWNSNPETTDAAWLAEIAAQRPAVLHFKGGRWKNEDLVRRAIAAATQGERA